MIVSDCALMNLHANITILCIFSVLSDIFDVVRDAKDCVFLLDFAPFSEKYSEALAFEWSELLDDNPIRTDDEDEEEDPEFRYLSSNCGIQPNKRNNYGIPKDVIDMFRPSSSSPDDPTTSQSPNTLDDVINNRLENVSFKQIFGNILSTLKIF